MNLFSSLFRKSILRRKNEKVQNTNHQSIDPQKLVNLEKVLKISFNNESYFMEALTHRSYLESDEYNNVSNERLEFLGDSVLSLIIAHYLFENFTDEDEGFLTKIRAKFVNKKSLSEAAEKLHLGNFLIIGNNMQRTILNNSTSVIADALEALIGAIFLDQGIDICSDFVNRILIEPNITDEDFLADENYKSQLLEYTQANKIDAPQYEVIKEEGPQHNRVFTIRVMIGEKHLGTGSGRNKKSAEQNAARRSLKKLLDTS